MTGCPLRWIVALLYSLTWTVVAIRFPINSASFGFGRGGNGGRSSSVGVIDNCQPSRSEDDSSGGTNGQTKKSRQHVLATVLAAGRATCGSSSTSTSSSSSGSRSSSSCSSRSRTRDRSSSSRCIGSSAGHNSTTSSSPSPSSSSAVTVTASSTATLAPRTRVTSSTSSSDQLTYLQTMAAGALSRSFAQVLMHPANTYKTMLQLKGATAANLVSKLTPERLIRGADAQFLLSLPHGAFYFFVIDRVKSHLSTVLSTQFSFAQDFAASTISTIMCSIVSTPQMVLTDRLMAGVYPSFPAAMRSIIAADGVAGFYTGWWPALAQKIPSYGLTWMFFQQLKRLHESLLGTAPGGEVSFALGAFASATAVAVMNPMDTVKTRLVTQMVVNNPRAYKGVSDCFVRVFREEGLGAFYRSLPPRLMSVVPMIAIQFGVYETIKDRFLKLNKEERRATAAKLKQRALSGVTRVKALAKRAKLAKRKPVGGTGEVPSAVDGSDSTSTSKSGSGRSSVRRSTLLPSRTATVAHFDGSAGNSRTPRATRGPGDDR